MNDLENEILVAVLSSTALATMLGSLFQLLSEWMKNKIYKNKIQSNREYKAEQGMLEKKEGIYIKALTCSLLIRNVLEGYRDEEKYSETELRNMVQEMNKLVMTVGPFLRLYSSKSIYESFRRLSRATRIIGSGVEITEKYIASIVGEENYFTKLIKKDLGIDV